MNRRLFLQCGVVGSLVSPLLGAWKTEQFEQASALLTRAVDSQQVRAAVLHVRQRNESFTRHFGTASSPDAMFLLGSISKPICVTALMTLYDKGEFRLNDPVKKFYPQFTGEGRDQVTLQHVLSHVSGLPDQLANNDQLRRSHSPMSAFVEGAVRAPLSFAPGTNYQYSSMGILLATYLAEKITGQDVRQFVQNTVMAPLGMTHSAQGLGKWTLDDVIPSQVEFAAPEAGAGDPTAKDWDWNSPYWRNLGATWGGTHASAPDIARWLEEFLLLKGTILKPETQKLMISNHNAAGLTPRGLGFNVGLGAGSSGCSERTFGHTGSTGTIAWADPATETICVVLTSLPARAVTPHPRDLVATAVAAGVL